MRIQKKLNMHDVYSASDFCSQERGVVIVPFDNNIYVSRLNRLIIRNSPSFAFLLLLLLFFCVCVFSCMHFWYRRILQQLCTKHGKVILSSWDFQEIVPKKVHSIHPEVIFNHLWLLKVFSKSYFHFECPLSSPPIS